MSLVINTQPSNYASVSDEMLFVLFEATKTADPVTYPDYRYVCDIYVASTLVARQIVRPDPVNLRGKFDVATVLRNYVAAYGLKANFASATETYTNKIAYQLKFGEQYGDTLYTNLLVDSNDRECYPSYAVRPFVDADILDNKLGSGSGDWATNMPATINGYKADKWQLLAYYNDSSGNTSLTAQFSAGSTPVGTQVTVSAYTAKSILQWNISFIKLAATLGLTQQQQDSITKLEVDGNINNVITVNYTCSKYPTRVLAWLNPYGGYDSYSFGLVSKKTKELTRKEFAQLNYRMDPSGVIAYHDNGVFYGSKKGYSARSKVMMRMTSHLLTALEYDWLAEMFASPDVYIYDTDLAKFIPVTITDNNYEHRTYLNSRLTPLEFTVEYSDQYNSQFL